MQPNSSFLAQLNAGDETPGDATYTTFRSDCDGVILPSESTALDGADNRLTACVGHTEFLRHRPTYEAVRTVVLTP